MERRDYLITQIQQLGRFLQLLAEKLLGKSSSLNLEEEISKKQEEFKEVCGFEMSLLATPVFEELKEPLLNNNSYNPKNIELLADYMVMLADKSVGSPLTFIHRVKLNALQLYELIEVSEKTYSIERQKKMAGLKNKI